MVRWTFVKQKRGAIDVREDACAVRQSEAERCCQVNGDEGEGKLKYQKWLGACTRTAIVQSVQ